MKLPVIFMLGVVSTTTLIADYNDQSYSAQPSVYYQEKETWGGQGMQRDPNLNPQNPQDFRDTRSTQIYRDDRNMQDSRGNMNPNYTQDSREMAPARQSPWGSQDRNINDNDRKLTQKIQDALKGGMFSKSYDTVTFVVTNGRVVLTGIVERDSDKKEVQKRIQDIDGIRDIENRVQAQQGSNQPNPSNQRAPSSSTRY